METKALAGYIDSSRGRRLAFAIYLNDLPITKVQDVFAVTNAIGGMASTIYTDQ
jgi:D-alanyl-D-alanine carboxypeptidase